tara:strand:- start:201 stop:419 length:219 start_codon:yes stop_codon:yes gene_type:complete
MGTLLAVVVQIVAVVWWASGVSASVDALETSDTIRNGDRKEFFERLSVVETKVITNNQILIRLEDKVDSLGD